MPESNNSHPIHRSKAPYYVMHLKYVIELIKRIWVKDLIPY